MQRINQAPAAKVWTPVDFLDLGSRDAVDKMLQCMVASNDLRRIDRGLYDQPRMTAVERQCERYLHAATTTPKFSTGQRLELFLRAVELTLQRELKHKGAANGDDSYSAELIGYVEIVT